MTQISPLACRETGELVRQGGFDFCTLRFLGIKKIVITFHTDLYTSNTPAHVKVMYSLIHLHRTVFTCSRA